MYQRSAFMVSSCSSSHGALFTLQRYVSTYRTISCTTTITNSSNRRQLSYYNINLYNTSNGHPLQYDRQFYNNNNNKNVVYMKALSNVVLQSSINRYQTTSSKNQKGLNDKEQQKIDQEVDKLTEGMEEIVHVPASALNDVIDRSKYTVKVPVPMPDLGVSNGQKERYSSIQQWFFQTGDIIQQEDIICDIYTPEFTFGLETDDEEITIMGDILVDINVPVPDGTILCYMLHEAKDGDIIDNNNNDTTNNTNNDDDEDDEDYDETEKDENKKAHNDKDDGQEKEK